MGRGCFSSKWVTLGGLFEKMALMLSLERLKGIIKDKQKEENSRQKGHHMQQVGSTAGPLSSFCCGW